MPDQPVPRVLEYVGLLLLFCLASTFAWWVAASVAKTEYRRLLSALACSMRVFFYSICLLCILVALMSFHLAPADPRSTLFGWLHLGGTVWICFPSAWRAFRVRGPRLVAVVLLALLLCFGTGWVLTRASPDFRAVVVDLPRYLSKA